MNVFIAGATGTLGRPVVRELVARGHRVTGLTRSDSGRRLLDAFGAASIVGDALDADQVHAAVMSVRPDQVVHLLTAIPAAGPLRARQLRPTNELRVRGTAHLLRAAIDAGARRIVAESFVGVYGAGVTFKSLRGEDEPLPAAGGGSLEEIVLALRSLEDQLRTAREARQIDTVALRIGFLYGSDVPSTQALISQARAGKLFAPRGMRGIGPFVHVHDAASAIVAAIERPTVSATYNVVDDRPMPMTEFLILLTRRIGERAPRRVPMWIVKLGAPLIAKSGSMELRLSNTKAKQELGWTLRYPTVSEGLGELPRAKTEAA